MATMQDVADRAGVSISTVSFIVNGTKPVSAQTRSRVEQAMRDLRYRRNPVGSALAKGRTRIIALLYPALQRPLSGTGVAFFRSAVERATERDYNLILWPISNDADQIAQLVRTGLVDGLLLMEVQLADERVDALHEHDTPFALIGRTQDSNDLAHVDVDFAGSIELAIDDLVAGGHSRFAMIDGGSGSSSFSGHGAVARSRASFLEITAQNGLTGVLLTLPDDPHAGRELGCSFAHAHPDISAVLILSEHAAPGFVAGLRHAGVQVPEQVSVISIGTSAEMAAMADPELTFMRAPGPELGRLGVDAIITRIESPHDELTQLLLPCVMVPGSSVAPYAGGGIR